MHLRLRKYDKLPQTYRKLANLRLRNTSCSFSEFAVAELSLNLRCPALPKAQSFFAEKTVQENLVSTLWMKPIVYITKYAV